MAELDERVAQLETGMDNHHELIADVRAEGRATRAELRAEIVALRTDMRTEIGALRSSMERGFERVDQKIDKHFMWLVGIMVTGFLTGFGAMFTLFMRVLDRLP